MLTVLVMTVFAPERLVKGTKGFFEPIAKLQIAVDINSKRKTPNDISNKGKQAGICCHSWQQDRLK